MTDTPQDLYDAVPYPCYPYPDTHPSQVASMAILHGLEPAPVERCRVLEIGCNAGANLISLAYTLPHSEFVGFDLAAGPVRHGQARAQALGLRNLRLLQANLLDADKHPELAGPFDYIIAHGVYAWVPDEVRDKLLLFCRQHLAPQGIAFISYAALPGGYLRLLTRDVLQAASPNHAGGKAPTVASGDWLEFVASTRPEGDAFRMLLERELESMRKRPPEAVFHDELAPSYQPVLFSQFMAHAHSHGLHFVCDAELPGPVDPSYRAEIVSKLRERCGDDRIAEEQLLDHLRMRMFRQTLLCPAETAVLRDVDLKGLTRLWMSSASTSAEGGKPGARTYTSPEGLRIESQHPAAIALLEMLIARYPESTDFQEISELLGSHGVQVDAQLLTMLLQLVVSRIVTIRGSQPPVSRSPGTHPVASALARADSREGDSVTTLLHTRLTFSDPISRELLQLLDGSRDREALLRDLAAVVPGASPESLAGDMETALVLMGQTGLLERPGWREA